MDTLDDMKKQRIESLQTKIALYQNDPSLCSELDIEQYRILAELQTIYNILNGITLSSNLSLYNNSCKGVIDQIADFIPIYSDMTPENLYINYIQKYQAAKTKLNKLDLN